MNTFSALIKSILPAGLGISLMIAALYIIHPTFIEFFNNKTTDAVMTLSKTTASAPSSVVVVDLDEVSLESYGQWPWPRYRLARLLGRIKDLGAGCIVLDLIFSEPDRTSPDNWQAEIGNELNYTIDLSGVPEGLLDHDRYLSDVLARGPFVLGYEFLFSETSGQEPACRIKPLDVVSVDKFDGDSGGIDFFKARGVVCNLPFIADAAAYSGFLNATPDKDGILRRVPLVIQYEDRMFPSIALATMLQQENTRQVYIREERSGIFNIALKNRLIPVDNQGNLLINFDARDKAAACISAAGVLDGKLRPEALKSKIVVVGSSAAGWQQVYHTNNRPVAAYSDILAHVMETLFSGRFVTRTQVFLLWEVAAGLSATLIVCISIAGMSLAGSAGTGVLMLICTWLAAVFVFRYNGFLLSPFLPSILILANFTSLVILKTRKGQHEASKRAEDAVVLMKTSEASLNSIIQTVPDIIFRVDPEGKITFVSPAVSKYAVRPDDMIGRPIIELVPEDDFPKARYGLKERRTGTRATHGLELRLSLQREEENPGEDTGYFSVSAEGIYSLGSEGQMRFIGTQGIIRDITEQKKLENKLMQAQKMEAVGNLAAGVAHDLNNVLSGLVSYPDLLLLELPPDSPFRKKVARIQRSGQKAAAIVQDLLTLARRAVTVSEVVQLNDIVTEYISSPEGMGIMACHPDIDLELDLAADLLNVRGSPVHLSKAVMNILNNAFESMPAGGRILLSTSNRYLDAPIRSYEEIPEGEYVSLRVSDEGVGINPEDLQRIFEPFYTKKMMDRSGTGLGMTVIWATVKDHGGYIDVGSHEGEGTRIVLYLPATREVGETATRRLVLEDYVGSERILVVDDVPEQREIAVKMLSKLGYEVSAVSSGEKAVAYMRENKADLLVLDMIMPGGMDGLETYRQIIEFHHGQKAIIASGYSESERARTLQKIGAGTYIQKPYTLEKIGVAVRTELDRLS